MRLNPVLARELRERVRGPRAAIILTLYLGLLVGIFYLVYRAQASSHPGGNLVVAPTEVARIGRGIFEWVLFIMLVLVLFLVPGLSAGSIAGERERQTLIPMQVTGLTARGIVTGKVSASLAFLFLLVVASLPLFSLSYLIGGIGLGQALRGLGVVLLTGVMLACVSTACSAFARRVQTATVIAYGLVLVMTAGSFVLYSAASLLGNGVNRAGDHPPALILTVNPIALTAAVIAGPATVDDDTSRTNSPMQPVHDQIDPIRFDAVGGVAPTPSTVRTTTTTMVGFPGRNGVVVGVSGGPAPTTTTTAPKAGAGGDAADVAPSYSAYVGASLLVMLGLIIGSVWFAAIRLRIPAETER